MSDNNFGIGIYHSNATINFHGPPSIPPVSAPIALPGTSTYTLGWWYVRDPNQVVHTPPAEIGLDLAGVPTVRGYSTMTWTYPVLRPDEWYLLYGLWRAHRTAVGPYAGKVLIQWPDPQSGQLQITSARWSKPQALSRNVPTFTNINFVFTHLSIDDATPPPGVWRVTQ